MPGNLNGIFAGSLWGFLRGLTNCQGGHGRRGGPMKEIYWNQFITSGRIDDYLKFKMHEKSSSRQEQDALCHTERNRRETDEKDSGPL